MSNATLTEAERWRLDVIAHVRPFTADSARTEALVAAVEDMLSKRVEAMAMAFEDAAAEAWGGDSAWLTTGSKVGRLAAEWVRSA